MSAKTAALILLVPSTPNLVIACFPPYPLRTKGGLCQEVVWEFEITGPRGKSRKLRNLVPLEV